MCKVNKRAIENNYSIENADQRLTFTPTLDAFIVWTGEDNF